MIDTTNYQPQPASPPPAPPEVVHEEPASGGSYTRNTTTGRLERNEPAPADQPQQE